MSSARTRTAQVWLRCPKCGNETPIWRRRSKLKEKRHVKHLWCVVCEKVTAHEERKR